MDVVADAVGCWLDQEGACELRSRVGGIRMLGQGLGSVVLWACADLRVSKEEGCQSCGGGGHYWM